MKVERIKQDEGRVRFGDLNGGDAFTYKSSYSFPPPILIKRKHYLFGDRNAFDPTDGNMFIVEDAALVTPLPDAVIRY